MTKAALILTNPRIVIEPDGDTVRVRFQDPDTREDLAVAEIDRDLAPTLADEFRSIAPPGAKSRCFRLDVDTLAGGSQ